MPTPRLIDDEGNPIGAGGRPVILDDEGNAIVPEIKPTSGYEQMDLPQDVGGMLVPSEKSNHFVGRGFRENLPAIAATVGGLGGPGGAGLGGALGTAGRELLRTGQTNQPVDQGWALANKSALEGVSQALLAKVGGGLQSAVSRISKYLAPLSVPRTPVERAAVDIDIPLDTTAGKPLGRPSTGILASGYAGRQEPRILAKASSKINELLPEGADKVSEFPVTTGEVTGATNASLTKRAKEIVEGERSELFAARGEQARQLNQVRNDRNAYTKGLRQQDQAASVQHAIDKAQLEAQAMNLVGGKPAPSRGDVGGQIQRGFQESRKAGLDKAGREFDEVLNPYLDQPVNVEGLMEQVSSLAKYQSDIPDVPAAQRFLMDNLPKSPDGVITGFDMPLGKVREFSQMFGSKIKFNPGRAEGPRIPLRQAAEDLIEASLPDQAAKQAYRNAKTTYAGDVVPTLKARASPVVKGVTPAAEQDSSAVFDVLFSPKSLKSARNARTALKGLQSVVGPNGPVNAPEGQAARDMLRPALMEHLLKEGIEKLPKRLTGVDDDVLGMYLGASDAKALKAISERMKRLGSKAQLPSKSALPAKEAIPTPDRPFIRNPNRDVQREGTVRTNFPNKPDIDAILEALTQREKPASPGGLIAAGRVGMAGGTALVNPTVAGVGLVVSEMSGLLRTIAMYHPQGHLAKFNRAFGNLLAGSSRPMIQFLGGLKTATDLRDKTLGIQDKDKKKPDPEEEQ